MEWGGADLHRRAVDLLNMKTPCGAAPIRVAFDMDPEKRREKDTYSRVGLTTREDLHVSIKSVF
jgi:hypothetical protein